MSYSGWQIDQFDKQLRALIKIAHAEGVDGRNVLGCLMDAIGNQVRSITEPPTADHIYPASREISITAVNEGGKPDVNSRGYRLEIGGENSAELTTGELYDLQTAIKGQLIPF